MWGDEIHRSGTGLAYRRTGAGPPVLLLHGIPGCSEVWAPTADRLRSSVDVIVPDLLGFGDSRRPASFEEVRAEAQASALDGLIDELDLGPAVVVGHDFGGPVALLLARRRPAAVAGLGLLAANTFTDTPIPFPLSLVTWPGVKRPARRLLFSRWSLNLMLRQGVGRGAPPLPAERLVGDRRQQRAIATIFAESLAGLDTVYRPVQDQLAQLAAPTFVGWGDHDPFFPVAQGRRTAEALGAQLQVYEGAGHFLPHERPGEVAAAVSGLLARVGR